MSTNDGAHPPKKQSFGVARNSSFREVRNSSTPVPNISSTCGFFSLRKLILLVCMASCLFLTSCTLRISYHFLDWWIGWQVRDYVPLDKQQRNYMERALDQFHLWHQNTQLPRYISTADSWQLLLQEPQLSPQQWRQLAREGQGLWEDSLQQLLPDVFYLFKQLNEKQWQNLQEAIVEQHEEYAARYIDVRRDKRLKLRREHLHDLLKPWIGTPNAEQREMILRWSEALQPVAEMSLQQRRVMLKQANQLFLQRQSLSGEEQRQRLWKLLSNDRSLWPEEGLRIIRSNQQLSFELASELHASLTPKQRRRLFKQLDSYRKDFRFLHHRYQQAL